MAAPPEPAMKPILPSITGNPILDTVLSGIITSIASGMTALCVHWATSHGYSNDGGSLTVQIFGGIASFLGLVAWIAYRALTTKKSETAVADHVVTALATGVIPQQIMAEAIKAPNISKSDRIQATAIAATIAEQKL